MSKLKDWFSERPYVCISETSTKIYETGIRVLVGKSGGVKSLTVSTDQE